MELKMIFLHLLLLSWSMLLTPIDGQSQNAPAEAFEISQLKENLDASGKSYLPFLNRSTLRTGLYILKAGSVDLQEPHLLDEVYYIISGKAKLRVEENIYEAVAGSVLYVKAGADHQFEEITDELQALVFFSTASP